MHNLDITPIPEEEEKWRGTTPRKLERVELRVDGERHQLRAVFSFTDRKGQTVRVLNWTPSTDEYGFERGEDDHMISSSDTMHRILDNWKEMFDPADYEKMRQQLGLTQAMREKVKLRLIKS